MVECDGQSSSFSGTAECDCCCTCEYRTEHIYICLRDESVSGRPHSGQYRVRKDTVACKNTTKGNVKIIRTLKCSGSVFGSPKRLDRWMSRNAGICPK